MYKYQQVKFYIVRYLVQIINLIKTNEKVVVGLNTNLNNLEIVDILCNSIRLYRMSIIMLAMEIMELTI